MTSRATAGDRLSFGQLQGLRGFAALGVVFFHAYQYDRTGPAGTYPYEGKPVVDTLIRSLDGLVDLFFVLSAFLLSLPYLQAALAGQGTTSARVFLVRRAVRILPLYWVAVTFVWATRNGSLPGNWRDLVEHLTFTQVFDRERIFFTIGPAWSLAVEVQFYVLIALLCGVLVAVAPRLGERARTVALLSVPALLIGTGLGYAAWAVGSGRDDTDWPVWFSLPAKIAVFGAGVLGAAAVALARRQGRSVLAPLVSPAAAWPLRVVGVAVLVLSASLRSGSSPDDLRAHLLNGVGYGLLVLAGVTGAQHSAWHAFWARGALPWLGLVSYSLYLWHEPVLLWLAQWHLLPAKAASAYPLTTLVLTAAGLVVAWASWWVIEYPASHLRLFVDRPESTAVSPLAPDGTPRAARRGYTVQPDDPGYDERVHLPG